MELKSAFHMRPDVWDEEIGRFDTKYLFHESAWLGFLERTQGGRALRFTITDGKKPVGYFAGLFVKKGPLRVLGSPLPGSTTNYMGPVVDEGFDYDGFLTALDGLCEKLKVHHVELGHPGLDPELMRAHGYDVTTGHTWVVPLCEDEQAMWGRLNQNCRRNIRKAVKNGLTVERCRPGEFVGEYYSQLTEVFAKKKLAPTYDEGRIRELFGNLHPGRAFALMTKDGDAPAATGIFVHDERRAYALGTASHTSAQPLFPNEILWWQGILDCARMGVRELDLCGGGSFKPKFGAVEVPTYKYAKSHSAVAWLGRGAYRAAVKAGQVIKGRLGARGKECAA